MVSSPAVRWVQLKVPDDVMAKVPVPEGCMWGGGRKFICRCGELHCMSFEDFERFRAEEPIQFVCKDGCVNYLMIGDD